MDQPLLHASKRKTSSKFFYPLPFLVVTFAYLLKSDFFHSLLPSTYDDKLSPFLQQSILDIENAIKLADHVKNQTNNPKEAAALTFCVELMQNSQEKTKDSVAALKNQDVHSYANVHTWLSGILTHYHTCKGNLEGTARSLMEPALGNLISQATTSLGIIVARLPKRPNIAEIEEFPTWVTSMDKTLLRVGLEEIKPNLVVAKDGSGNFKTVQEAVTAAPNNSNTRFVIYIKKGIYQENVVIDQKKKNLMIVGDGMDSTIITAALYSTIRPGIDTYHSATFGADAEGFIAQDICFQNTAGPKVENGQAVALRVGGDKSIINRCRIEGYQDTLLTFIGHQFFRDCTIIGTIDFIFGDAAVVLQNCTIIARKPLPGQFNAITAQGRKDPNQVSGISIQHCRIIASNDLEPVKSSVKTYLGRPWMDYSTTVVMQSYIGDHIDPEGWAALDGRSASLNTIHYREFSNCGPGANTSKRVCWKGYRVINDTKEAMKFTVAGLLEAESGPWLKATGVNYTEGLYGTLQDICQQG
ncbi:hypothetical protein SLE2022_194330 [Rubroshorea leprosula]